MAHCTNCGTQIEPGARFCPSCGAAAPQSGQSGQSPYQSAAYQPPIVQAQPQAADAQNNKAMGALAYLGILVLIPLFAAKDSKFARFHANQGLVLLIAEVAFSIVYSILISIFTSLLFSTGSIGVWGIITTLLGLLWLVFPILAIIGLINALNLRTKPLPIIGAITLLK